MLAAALVLHAILPLVHASSSHDHIVVGEAALAFAADGGTAIAVEHQPDHDEGACRTCVDLVLVKQILPRQPPLLLPRPESARAAGPERAESRAISVDRDATPPRGPPARA